MKLEAREVEKPWGRDGGSGRKVGEIWFEARDGRDLPLLVKYLFTSEALSVQVHPTDAEARARGLPNGKDECWYVVEALPGARIGLGFDRALSPGELRAAALDGSIERLMSWHEPRAGDFFSVPAGTVHAIGAGLSLIEVQQPSDTTYRLYDYGRPRELHLDDAVAVASAAPYPPELRRSGGGLLLDGPHFAIALIQPDVVDPFPGRERFLLPVGERECFYLTADEPLPPRFAPALLAAAP